MNGNGKTASARARIASLYSMRHVVLQNGRAYRNRHWKQSLKNVLERGDYMMKELPLRLEEGYGESVKTNHTTKNFKVFRSGKTTYCTSYGVIVAANSEQFGLMVGEKWEYSQTTINHVKWFFKEYGRLPYINVSEIRDYIDCWLIPVISEVILKRRSIFSLA